MKKLKIESIENTKTSVRKINKLLFVWVILLLTRPAHPSVFSSCNDPTGIVYVFYLN